MCKTHALILGGGKGLRFTSKQPKQFSTFHSKPLFIHSIISFLNWHKNESITLVMPTEYIKHSQKLIQQFLPIEQEEQKHTKIKVVGGRDSRHLSCLAGLDHILKQCQTEDTVLIHDAARPLLNTEELKRLWESLRNSQYEVASLAAPISETVVQAKAWYSPISHTLDRTQLYAVKTPQIAYAYTLNKMIDITSTSPKKPNFTDLLSWAQYCNIPSILVQSESYNQKITRQEDLIFLEAITHTDSNPSP